MIEKKKDFNYILQGQINSARGSMFEEDCIRLFIGSADKDTKVLRHLIMDFAVFERDLYIYDAKTTANIDVAIKEAQESFDKISESKLFVSVLSPYKDPKVIFHDEEKSDKDFKNNKLNIVTSDVSELKSYINNLFNSLRFLDKIKAEFSSYKYIKSEIDKLIKRRPNAIEKYFISISGTKKELLSRRNKTKRRIKKIISGGNYTNDDFYRESLKEHWEMMEEKW